MNRIVPSLLLVLLIGNGCQTKGPVFNPMDDATGEEFQPASLTNRIEKAWLQPPSDLYRLGPGDTIDIETLGDSAARSSLLVGPDGKIYYSLLPGVSVWGLTLGETRSLLDKEMRKFAKDVPEMVLNLRFAGSKKYWLMGAVGSGVYSLATPTTLLEAISAVGGIPVAGVDDTVDLQKSFIMRDGHLLPVNFEKLFKGGDLSENIYLQADDFVFLRPIETPSVSVLGAIGAPNLVPHTKDLTVARAIIAAGGTVKYAQANQVIIIRGSLTQPQIAEVNYRAIVTGKARDVRLKAGDILYVPYSPFRKIAQLAEEVLDQVVRTAAVNEGIKLVDPNAAPVGFSAGVGVYSTGGINTGGK